MNPIIEINQAVDVIATFRQAGHAVKAMPVQIQWNNRDVKIEQLGLCHPVRHGSRLCYIFDVSDGANDYSLEFDTTTLKWTLISMIDGGSLC